MKALRRFSLHTRVMHATHGVVVAFSGPGYRYGMRWSRASESVALWYVEVGNG